MGYLDNSSITIDAILTKKGRELLSRNPEKFTIKYFAVADDEIDYNLWNPAHSLGSDFYGIIIENTPIVEAVSDESQMMKYKLITLGRNVNRIPVLQASSTSVTAFSQTVVAISVSTLNGGNETLGYTATLLNSDVAVLTGNPGAGGNTTDPVGANEDARSVTVTGLNEFKLTLKSVSSQKNTTLIIIGNGTGGRLEIPITVNPRTNTEGSVTGQNPGFA